MSPRLTRAVVLDLDDTLYLERDYVRSGFATIGRHLALQGIMNDFFEHAWSLFEAGGRNTIFNQVLGDPSPVAIDSLVELYRSHVPDIALCPDAARFLDRFPADRPLAMITDGPVASQSAKVHALGIEKRIKPIVMSDSFGIAYRKPHVRPFEAIERALGLSPQEITYIADNPLKDFVTPRRRGWRTIRVQRAMGEHAARTMAGEYAAHVAISGFDELSS